MQEQQSNQVWFVGIGMLLLGFVIGLLVSSATGTSETEPTVQDATTTQEETMSDATTTSTGTVQGVSTTNDTDNEATLRATGTNNQDGSYAVSVTDQPSGDTVTVRSASLKNAGWIAVREMRDGGMGNVLGAQWEPAGTHEDIEVTLLRGTETGETYFVTLYTDDGDKEFQHYRDTLVEVNGETVYSQFTTTD